MRKSPVAIPLLALIAGVFGFIFRQMAVNTGFDSVTGFAIRNFQPTQILIVISFVTVVLIVVFGLVVAVKFKAENDYAQAFHPRGSLYFVVSFLMGLATLAAGALYVIEKLSSVMTVIDIVFVFLAALTAFAVIILARGAYRERHGTEMLLFSLVPAIFFSYWLVILYKENAANPVLLFYCYQALAISAAALSTYFSAGFVYKKAATGRTIGSYLMTIYFCTVVLADNLTLPVKILFAATAVIQFVNAVVMIRNLKDKDEE